MCPYAARANGWPNAKITNKFVNLDVSGAGK